MPKVLIVDDDADIVESMKLTLEKHGYAVAVAADGTECLQRVGTENPDLVILDVMMPGPDGFEVARAMRKDGRTKDIPILILTAIKDRTGLDFEKEAGDPDWLPVDDYCNKPLDYEVLLEKIAQLLQKKKK